MNKLGFKKILKEPYVLQKDEILGFFSVDNIVFTFIKDQDNKDKMIVESLSQVLTIKVEGKLKCFLGLHVICNHIKQTSLLSYKVYIMKIYN